jgi:hypothetical protein
MAVWTLIPDKINESETRIAGKWGVFGATLVTFFLAEMEDKTQIATIALAAHYGGSGRDLNDTGHAPGRRTSCVHWQQVCRKNSDAARAWDRGGNFRAALPVHPVWYRDKIGMANHVASYAGVIKR